MDLLLKASGAARDEVLTQSEGTKGVSVFISACFLSAVEGFSPDQRLRLRLEHKRVVTVTLQNTPQITDTVHEPDHTVHEPDHTVHEQHRSYCT